MNYLLDTNVISELRKQSVGRADERVIAWAKSIPTETLYLSSICIFEIEMGVLQMERRDPRQGAGLRAWMEQRVFSVFAARILPVDTAVAMRCAALHVPDPRAFRDSAIAATALVHGMTVVTRNVRDFASVGVPLLNPWER